MKTEFKPIAMKCTQEQFEELKPELEKIGKIGVLMGAFTEYEYLTNVYKGFETPYFDFVSKGMARRGDCHIFESFNAETFLKYCGVETEPAYKITKEQIKQLDKGETNVRQLFSEVFENELEVGKWYKSQSERGCTYAYFQGFDVKTYGISHFGEWVDEAVWFNKKGNIVYDNFGYNLEHLKPATQQEIETALINEARKRGFKEGVWYKSVNTGSHFKLTKDIKYKIYDGNNLYQSEGTGFIFLNGNWAQIIEPEITYNNCKYILKEE